MMDAERMTHVLSAHADHLVGQSTDHSSLHLTDEEYRQIAPLFQLAERLNRSMTTINPSASFVKTLGQELTEQAQRQVALTKRIRRAVLIGAAAIGSLLSVASVIGAIIFVVARWRTRDQTRTLQATPG